MATPPKNEPERTIQAMCESPSSDEVLALIAVAQTLSQENTYLRQQVQDLAREKEALLQCAQKKIFLLKGQLLQLDRVAAHNRKVAIQVAELTDFVGPRLNEMLSGTVTCADDFASASDGLVDDY